MITGIGLDIVELGRVRRLDSKSAKFRQRVLTDNELAEYELLSANRKTEFLAGRFAAKEAFGKAKGTGIGKVCAFKDIEIRKDLNGKPSVYFQDEEEGLISITHTKEYAAAQILLQSKIQAGENDGDQL
ncbi:holo-ACP synthase [Planococcus halotolerans]|uniref:Holo-[acyl-carrier-protein] synthase n=1 Tax=Planococcus halotolerans TaxID=2233542 RepID=A0A365KS18_9BACL|nr:holo-ACP synthase [Planococcus halotolerans]QHJ69254.1 holo-[acyl-carrier-protein] synthase [Planococcus halotolerans]RAZ75769.1 holo-[acyl-carrier-protein] synthase [Planococcus halotolerans]